VRAVWLTAFGPPENLVAGEAPDPAGRTLVEVAYANLTFVETQFRATGMGPFAGELPMIPGNGVGGVTADGTRVIGATGGSGGYAERAVVADPIAVPEGLDLDVATALLADGRTATALIALAQPEPGERVLVEAAAGGVGTLLVQLAKAAGATVVAAAGGERKLALARELGADETVDYREPGWEAAGPFDVVFDGVGGEIARAAHSRLRPDGRMVSFGLASGAWADVPSLRPPRPTAEQSRAYTQSALAEAAAGRLRPVIGQRFALEHAAQAHAAIESRATLGKTLLEVMLI
jgi:NADPH2:quinone reductase